MTVDTYVSILVIYTCLFFGGYSFLRAYVPNIGVISACALGLHIGISIWAVIWVVFYILGVEYGYGWSSPLNFSSTIAFLGVAMLSIVTLSVRAWRRWSFNLNIYRDLSITMAAFVVVAAYSIVGYYLSTNLWIAGDSYYFLFWSADPAELLHHGFPLVNLSIAHLSTLVIPNYYLSQLFPLMAIGLGIFLADFVYRTLLAGGVRNRIWEETVLVLVTFGFFIFVGNSMFMFNSVYLNHHLLAAGLFALLGQITWVSSRYSMTLGHLFTIALLAIAISISRMEGFIFVVIFLAAMLAVQRNKRAGLAALLVAGGASLPYVQWLTDILNEDSFVKAQHYSVMLGGYVVIVLISGVAIALRLKTSSMVLVGWVGMSFGVLLAIYSRPEHMISSLYFFTKNALSPAHWGALVWLTILGVVGVFYSRVKSGDGFVVRPQDGLFHVFGFCVGAIILMTYLRSPLRYGDTDSANRMLFHFLPLIWVAVQVELIRRFANFVGKRGSVTT